MSFFGQRVGEEGGTQANNSFLGKEKILLV